MASAAGLLSPGLVGLVKRAQQLREEMDEKPTKLVAMDANSLPRKNGKRKVNTYLRGCVICRDKCSASKKYYNNLVRFPIARGHSNLILFCRSKEG